MATGAIIYANDKIIMTKKKIEYTIDACLECRYVLSKFSALCGHPKTPSKKIPALLNIPSWCPLADKG